jgi:hypothetical protein
VNFGEKQCIFWGQFCQKKRQTGKTGKNKNKNGLLQIHFLFYVFASPDLKILIGRYRRRGAPPPL